MQKNNIRQVLVLAPFHDSVTHIMHLRIQQEMTPDDVKFQILLQLFPMEETSSSSFPLLERENHFDLSRFELLLMYSADPSVVVPFQVSAFLTQLSIPRLLMHYSHHCPIFQEKKTSDERDQVTNELHAPSIPSDFRSESLVLSSPECTVKSSSFSSSLRERFERSNKVMLYIVGQVLSELAIQAHSDCNLTLETWPTMLSMALEKENVSFDKLDYTVADQFKRTILTSLSRGIKIRNSYESKS